MREKLKTLRCVESGQLTTDKNYQNSLQEGIISSCFEIGFSIISFVLSDKAVSYQITKLESSPKSVQSNTSYYQSK